MSFPWRRLERSAFGFCLLALGCVPLDPSGDPPAGLVGLPSDPASTAIADLKYVARAEDFAGDHPDAPGLRLSFNTLHVIFSPGATLGEVNALLSAINAEIVGGVPGTPDLPGILQVRVPTGSHAEMTPIYQTLRDEPLVAHVVPDMVLAPQSVPASNGGDPAGWDWRSALDDGSGAWGAATCRVPQLWNLNEGAAKLGRGVRIGVLDAGFDASHADLDIELVDPASDTDASADSRAHGLHTAGIIGATFDNGAGVDGVNPFADVIGCRMTTLLSFMDIVNATSNVRVINVSLGLGVTEQFDPTGAFVAEIVDAAGAVIAARINRAGASSFPMLIVAAGNLSSAERGGVSAAFTHPFANAAFAHGAQNIIVVESLNRCGGCESGVQLRSDSCVGGDLSAPGQLILSTMNANSYNFASGTSAAAAHVAGVVGYLYALEPSLTHQQVKQALGANTIPIADAADQVDAWAAAMDLDRLTNTDRVLRMALDIDDGTLDGNQRVDIGPSLSVVTGEDADGDGGAGDGNIDMSDFRRFRDWLLQVENDPDLALNGLDDHPKKDVNGNGVVEAPELENHYPRGDFNGDGRIGRLIRAVVPGVALSDDLTDLEVLQLLFDDPYYGASELPGLLDSADIEVAPLQCAAFSEDSRIVRVISRVEVTSTGTEVANHDHDADDAPRRVYTLPVSNETYTVIIEGMDSGGEVVTTEQQAYTVSLGNDYYWPTTQCDGELVVQITLAEAIEPGSTTPLLIRAGMRFGDDVTSYDSGIGIGIEVAGGTVVHAQGVTDDDGFFSTELTANPTYEVLAVIVTATAPNGEEVVEIASRFSGRRRVLDAVSTFLRSDLFISDPPSGQNAQTSDDATIELEGDTLIPGTYATTAHTTLPDIEGGSGDATMTCTWVLNGNADGVVDSGSVEFLGEWILQRSILGTCRTRGQVRLSLDIEVLDAESRHFRFDGIAAEGANYPRRASGYFRLVHSDFDNIPLQEDVFGTPDEFAAEIHSDHTLGPGSYFMEISIDYEDDIDGGNPLTDSASISLMGNFSLD